jgi:hypothetical protein
MRRQRRTTVIVVGGALAIASVGYGLGSQAGDGTAVADNTTTEQDGGPAERGAPPGLGALAGKLGVDSGRLATAMRAYHERTESNRRDDFTAKLANALGVSTDRVRSAFDGLQQKRESRFATRLADALGMDAGRVKAALDNLRDDGARPHDGPPSPGEPHSPGDFAQKLADELGVDASDVDAALMKIHPFHGPGRPGHRHDAMPLRQLAHALGVSRADLRHAFSQLRPGGEDGWKAEQQGLAKFLAGRFNLDLGNVQDALAAVAPPLRSPHPEGPRDHTAAL